ncbi:MAG: hypothetical protein QW063_01195 [Candidatus Nanoarchaeia archaeon]
MSFLRIKIVPCSHDSKKKYTYVYEVENYRDKKKVKQKTLRFLGKVLFLKKELNSDIPFAIEKFSTKNQVIAYLLAKTLANYGFKSNATKTTFCKKDITINLNNKTVKQKNTKIYLAINDGFLGDFTLKKVFRATDYKELTRWLVQSGLIPKPKKFDQTDKNFEIISAIISKFGEKEAVKEMSFDEFIKKIGY